MSPIEDVSPSAAQIMQQAHRGVVRGDYRPMRGQAYIRPIQEKSSLIIELDRDPREVLSHRGMVIRLGPPMRTTEHEDSPEIPWDVKEGDEVVYNLFAWLDRMRSFEAMVVVAQVELAGVVER